MFKSTSFSRRCHVAIGVAEVEVLIRPQYLRGPNGSSIPEKDTVIINYTWWGAVTEGPRSFKVHIFSQHWSHKAVIIWQ